MKQQEEYTGLYVTFAIYNLFLWPGLLFFILRRNFEPIKSRGFSLAIIQMLLGEVVMIFSLIPDSFSCFFRPAALLLIVPFICIPYVIRGLVLYHRYILHDGMKIWAGRHHSTSLSSVDSDAEMLLKNLSSNGNGSKNDSKNGSEHEEGQKRQGSHRKEREKKRSIVPSFRREGDLGMKEVSPPPSPSPPSPSSSPSPSPSPPPLPADQEGPSLPPTAAENAVAAGEISTPPPPSSSSPSSRAKKLFPEETRKHDFALDLKLDKKFIWAVRNKKFFNERFLIALNFLLGLPFVAVILLLFFLDEGIYDEAVRDDFSVYVHNRCFTRGFVPYFLVQFSLICPSISITAFLLLGVKEAFKVRMELLMIILTGSGGFLLCLVSIFGDIFPPALNYCFFGCMATVFFSFLTLVYPVIESYRFERIERKEKPSSDEELKIGSDRPSSSPSTDNENKEKNEVKDVKEVKEKQEKEREKEKEKKKKKKKSMNDDKVLKAIFEEPELLKDFEEFAVSTWCMENVLFYKRVQNFKKMPDSRLLSEGKKIWSFHFERSCDFEVNVDAPVRERIMEMIQQNKVERDMFDDAEKIVFTMLRFYVYPHWKASSGYRHVLEKLGSPDILSLRDRKKAALRNPAPVTPSG